jgi:uncharacterized protein YqgV (UPF0045/DUF77 family)
MNENLINIAIQVLPESKTIHPYTLVDWAIKVIDESGYPYKVCPFETVVECTLAQGLDLIEKIHQKCSLEGAEKMMTYIKIQSEFGSDVFIQDKIEKYS